MLSPSTGESGGCSALATQRAFSGWASFEPTRSAANFACALSSTAICSPSGAGSSSGQSGVKAFCASTSKLAMWRRSGKGARVFMVASVNASDVGVGLQAVQGGRAMRAVLALLAGRLELAEREQRAAEVALVERLSADGFVDGLHLGEREGFGQQAQGDGGIFDLGGEAPARARENVFVVESQSWQTTERLPSQRFVRAQLDGGKRNQREVGDVEYPSPATGVVRGEGVELLEIDG